MAANPEYPSQHTPGPWRAIHDFDGDYGIFPEKLADPIAVTYTDTDIDEANARLIAAAPALLKALSELLRLVRNPSNEYAYCRMDGEPLGLGDQMTIGCACEQAEAAISEATGATPEKARA